MKIKYSLLTILSFSFLNCLAQKESVWDNYTKSQIENTEPILPDFSYAGYKYSEVPIPVVDYKVFDITKYGAIPNDNKSDKKAIEKAILAAQKNGEGIIYFPKGKFYINTDEDEMNVITIKSSKIVFRGEDRDASILFVDKDQEPKNPKQLWSSPTHILAVSYKRVKKLANIVSDSKRETHIIEVDNSSKIKKGDWITIKVSNNDPDLVKKDLYPLLPDKSWTKIIEKGVQVNEHHKVDKVIGNTIHLVSKIHYDIQSKYNWSVDSFEPIHHIGFENMTFEGNWTKKFVHHRSAQDDGGWKIIALKRVVDSWVKDVTFRNVTSTATYQSSAASSFLNVLIEGNTGHGVGGISGSTGILIGASKDNAGMHHSFGVAGNSSSGNVIWRCVYPSTTSFESHASQPRTTLFDKVEGGFFQGRAGGARFNLPNHGKELVLWNYKETDEAEESFNFISKKTWYWRIVPPIIVGFYGSGTTFNKEEVRILESLGKPVNPESLFEAQLTLRLGKLPNWIKEIKSN